MMLTHTDYLAELLTSEQGKPLAEAKGEVAYGWFCVLCWGK